jgi:hypothetical protein
MTFNRFQNNYSIMWGNGRWELIIWRHLRWPLIQLKAHKLT